MRKILTCALVLGATIIALAQGSYQSTQAKANRFFENREWGSASAMYNFMLLEKPDVPDTYGRAIVATEMLNDTVRSMELLSQAMKHSVPLDSVLSNVRRYSYNMGHSELYETFMLEAAADNPWLARPLDSYLLKYYSFRRNGPKMVEYAQRMLKGAPDNASFLSTMAQGYMIDGKTQKAVECWQKILEHDSGNYDAVLNLANYYDLNGDPTNALFYFRRAQQMHDTPYVAEAIKRLAPHA